MSDFSHLLKNSRLAALPRALGKKRGGAAPSHAIVETRASALSRNEWGLKYSLPSKVKSRFVTFNDFDSMERIVDFETNGSFNWKRLRFQETGLVPSYDSPRDNPLFFDHSRDSGRFVSLATVFNITPQSDPKEVLKVLREVKGLRDEFRNWLLKKDPILLKNKKFTQQDLNGPAVEFLSQYRASKPIVTARQLQMSHSRVQGSGGLSYGLKGRLAQSPNGVVQKYVGPGRFTNVGTVSRVVAFGGFTAEVPNSASNLQFNKSQSEGKVPRETIVPFIAERAVVKGDGAIHIKTNVVSKSVGSASNDEGFFKTQSRNLAERKKATRTKTESVQDLLSLIRQHN